MNLKHQLKIYLAHTGLNVSQLSKKAGVPNATIADWIGNRKPRNFDQVKRVADVFKISLDHLLYGEGIASNEKLLESASFIGDGWTGGIFEIRIRRVNKKS